MVTPRRVIDVCNEVFGKHAGARALHAKGTLARGTFTATPEAAALTKASAFQGDPVDVTVRFSNGSGDPDEPDYAQDVRGMAVKLYAPDGKLDIVGQTAPRFPVKTPDGFAELLKAQERSPKQAIRMPLFLARNRSAIGGLPANLAALKAPASYATRRYYPVHAYKWVDADGDARFVRYTLTPEGGEDENISGKDAKARGADYLRDDIVKRLEGDGVRFTLELQIAQDGDDVDDPTSQWKSVERVSAGTIELNALETTREKGDDVLVFDPTHVVEGIELSGDPILRFRRGAYDESVGRRSGVRLDG